MADIHQKINFRSHFSIGHNKLLIPYKVSRRFFNKIFSDADKNIICSKLRDMPCRNFLEKSYGRVQ